MDRRSGKCATGNQIIIVVKMSEMQPSSAHAVHKRPATKPAGLKLSPSSSSSGPFLWQQMLWFAPAGTDQRPWGILAVNQLSVLQNTTESTTGPRDSEQLINAIISQRWFSSSDPPSFYLGKGRPLGLIIQLRQTGSCVKWLENSTVCQTFRDF